MGALAWSTSAYGTWVVRIVCALEGKADACVSANARGDRLTPMKCLPKVVQSGVEIAEQLTSTG
ncbi:hypothetical protein CH300_27945 [Rhodococcus sp. 15-1154-1]|nr:hypothetical protein CH300_27945 [Rhodococcus sp. 15-1154-1]